MATTDIIGFIGVTILLIAFFLQLINIISKDSYAYILMNIAGAGIACMASVMLNFWPFIILEATWTLVSAWGLFRFAVKK